MDEGGEAGFCDCCCSQESSVYFFAGRDVLFWVLSVSKRTKENTSEGKIREIQCIFHWKILSHEIVEISHFSRRVL